MADRQAESGTSRRIPPALIGAVLLAGAVLAFVFQNTGKARVEWLFFTVTAPLWVLLLVTGAASLVAGELASMAVRHYRKK